jgi:hypothetical protein
MRTQARFVHAICLFLAAAVPSLHAAGCSPSSAAGKWASTANGMLILPTGAVPVAAVLDFSLDTSGNLVGKQTRSLGGQVVEETFAGTLTVNHDCTGDGSVQVFENRVLVRTTGLHVLFDDNVRSARGIFTSVVLPNGTALPAVITTDSRRIFPKDN